MLLAIAQGDQKAFEALYRHYQPVIYTFAFRTSRSETLAQEIVQDAFLKVWLKRENLKEIDNFGGWLYTLSSHIAYDALRKVQTRERRVDAALRQIEDTPQETFTSTETLLLEKEYAALLETAVRTLPERQQETFRLIKQEGMSREQAATAMGISEESVKTNLAKALSKIRAHCVARMGTVGLLIFLWATR